MYRFEHLLHRNPMTYKFVLNIMIPKGLLHQPTTLISLHILRVCLSESMLFTDPHTIVEGS